MSVRDLANIEAGTYAAWSGDLILFAARTLHVDFRFFVTRDFDEEEARTSRVYRALREPTPGDEFRLRLFFHFAAGEVELRDTLAKGIETQPVTYPPSSALGAANRDYGREVARLERRRLGLGDAPIENVFALMRGQGVRLKRQHFPDSTLSGLTATHPRAGTCVLVNYTDDLYRQMFSAAHEYAHVLVDRPTIDKHACVVSYTSDRADLVEVRANAFAAEFMLPHSAMRAKWAAPADDDEIRRILLGAAKRHFVNADTVDRIGSR